RARPPRLCAGGWLARWGRAAARRRAAPTRMGRQPPAATARANTAPSSATRRVLARSRGRQYCRRHAKSCEPATPTVVRSNGLAPALPALHGAQAKQSPDRRPARASQLPLSASDSSCHGAADSTPVLLPESSLAHTTLVPLRRAESQLPLGGTRATLHAGPLGKGARSKTVLQGQHRQLVSRPIEERQGKSSS